jgi:hypothetical protein
VTCSIVSECLAHARPLVFVRRDFFNEEPFLRKKLEVHNAAIEMKRRDFLEGHWGPYLMRACSLTVRYTWVSSCMLRAGLGLPRVASTLAYTQVPYFSCQLSALYP